MKQNNLGQFSPAQEIYSINESFLDLAGCPSPGAAQYYGRHIRQRIGR